MQEMIAHWPTIVSYIGSTGQHKDIQHVGGRACVFGIVLLFVTLVLEMLKDKVV